MNELDRPALPEHAVLIPRVSSGRQREEDQTPGLTKYAEGQAYIIDAIVPIHGQSAFHGKHLKQLRAAINQYVKDGNATVVIFRDVDRSSRQGAQATFDLRGEIIRAGGRLEFSGQTYLNDQRTQEMLLGLLATAAKEESETKSRRKLQGNAARTARGEVVGKAAWGYVLAVVGGLQILVPTEVGRTWIPKIYTMAAEGKSLRFIRNLLTSEGVPSAIQSGTWNIEAISRIIASPTYKGERRGKGNMEYEALVSVELWGKANAAVSTRRHGGRGASRHEPALAKPVCGNCLGVKREGAASNVIQEDGTKKLVPSGRSPMYLKYPSKSSGNKWNYYQCFGHGPARKSCGGPSIREEVLNQAIDAIMSADTRPHEQLVYIPGDDNAERLAKINDAIAKAGQDMDYIKVAELAAEATLVRNQPHRRGRAERVIVPGMTVGKHWQTLDRAAKREELLKWEIIAYADHVKINRPMHDQEGRTVIGDLIEAEALTE